MRIKMIIDYRMHAYQDDNFKELSPAREMTWAELLKILSVEFRKPTPEDFFSKVLNDYLNNTGLTDAQVVMPRAHAVSRAQINIRSLHTIKHRYAKMSGLFLLDVMIASACYGK
ncbi:MAG: hypothetical protein GAK29_04499 [Acinetobacter bereziniae]|uniref:Uncharacterized protein n=1 Tax=Acinetobacter bereziniae TaxID=106648 RepID=A0A833PB85_ACIBZ|nr:MAG: hypothetical protein GAK29_04499 [Acinetobacter bereziniae]